MSSAFHGIDGRQFVERAVQIEHAVAVDIEERQVVAEGHPLAAPVALLGMTGSGAINHDMAHYAGGEPEERAPIHEVGLG